MLSKCRVLQLATLIGSIAFFCAPEAVVQSQDFPQRSISPEIHIEQLGGKDRADFDRIAELLADSQWDEAVETLRRLMENHGEKMIPLAKGEKTSSGFVRYVRVKHVCQMFFAAMKKTAPQALASYRSQIDPIAQRWYEQGVQQRDEALLRRVVEEALMSSYGDKALWRLGEIALERGDYRTAREYWERIDPRLRTPAKPHSLMRASGGLPLWLSLRGVDLDQYWSQLEPTLTQVDGQPNWLAFPDTDLNLAEVRARLVLVSILEGARNRARTELDLLIRLHPEASGHLLGREGGFAELLGKLLVESEEWPAVSRRAEWITFGGSAYRNTAAGPDVDIRGPPIWERQLQVITSEKDRLGLGRQRTAEFSSGLLSHHPLVVDEVVLVNDFTSIRAFRLRDGKPAWPGGDGTGLIYGTASQQKEIDSLYPREDPHVGVPRFTMTVHGRKLFARMGSPVTGYHRGFPLSQERGFLVALDLDTQKVLFDPIKPDGPEWAFEGSPVCDGVGIYIAMRYTKQGQTRANLHVACFDIHTGRQRWRKAICGAESLSRGKYNELTHNLLTLAEGTIYCNTNLGAVAALSTRDGSIAWITRYPRAASPNTNPDETDRTFFRDLNPCIFYRGLVITAPADCDRLFALDASTGQVIWKTPSQLAADAVHLLGVGSGNLLMSGNSLYWIDVFTGKLAAQFPPHTLHGEGFARAEPAGFGRGLLVGNRVYWPTKEKIHVFSQKALKTKLGGKPMAIRQPIDLIEHQAAGGNLLVSSGILMIATAEKLFALNEFGKKRKSLQTDQRRLPSLPRRE